MTHVLYRYRPLSNPEQRRYLLEIFDNNCLYCAAPNKFNDPFECTAQISFDAPQPVKRERAKQQLLREGEGHAAPSDEAADHKWRELERHRGTPFLNWLHSDTGVVTFSAVPDDLLMWSHYASHHTGVCIRFEATTESHVDFMAHIFEVQYQDAVPSINFYTTSLLKKLHAHILTKSRHWHYEQEWRRIIDSTREPRHLPLPPGIITGVFLGCRTSPSDAEAVVASASRSPSCDALEVLQARLSPNSYSLQFVPSPASGTTSNF